MKLHRPIYTFLPFLTAAGPLLGAAVGAASNLFGQRSANRSNVRQAQNQMAFEADQAQTNRDWQVAQADKQMAFQERMSSSAAQRAQADYEKAGLNPILAAKAPASAPGGAMGGGAQARGTKAEIRNIAGAFDANSAVNALTQRAEIRRIEKSADVLEEQAKLVVAQTRETNIKSRKGEYSIQREKWDALISKAEEEIRHLGIRERELAIEMVVEQIKVARREGDLSASDAGIAMRWIRELTQSITGASRFMPRR